MQFKTIIALAMATIATAAPATSAPDAGAAETVVKRACPYKDVHQCINQENLACFMGCSGRPRQLLPCQHECMAATTNICIDYGC